MRAQKYTHAYNCKLTDKNGGLRLSFRLGARLAGTDTHKHTHRPRTLAAHAHCACALRMRAEGYYGTTYLCYSPIAFRVINAESSKFVSGPNANTETEKIIFSLLI